MNTAERIDFIRSGMLTRRYHQRYTAEPDTVGKHQCGVALFVNMIDPSARKEVIIAAMSHDLAEAIVGDLPAPTKRALSKELKNEIDEMEYKLLRSAGLAHSLTGDEELLLKLGDYLDGLWFCIEERRRGNTGLNKVAHTYSAYLLDLMETIDLKQTITWSVEARTIVSHSLQTWREVQ